MNYFVYIVQCKDKTLYSGWTTDVPKRIAAHNTSDTGAKYTKSRRPVVLLYQEKCDSENEARKREYQLKQLTRSQKFELIDKSKKVV